MRPTIRSPCFRRTSPALAFVSTRTGDGDIYLLTLATGDVRRLTFDDGLEQLDGWSRDGKWVYFSSSSHDLANGVNDVYRVSSDGGTPMPVSGDRYANEYFSAASPDGRLLALSARGIASGQWWRHGHSHIDEAEIWLRDLTAGDVPAAWRALTNGGAKELWPMWAADGKSLLYVSDRSGAENIWADSRRGRPAAAADPIHRRPRAVAVDHRPRRRDGLRAQLRDLEARGRQRHARARCRSRGWARPPVPLSSTCA